MSGAARARRAAGRLLALPSCALATAGAPAGAQPPAPADGEVRAYVAALRLLAPPPGQLRWLAPDFLPDSGGGAAPVPPALHHALLTALGRGFRPLDHGGPPPRPNGGVLTLAPITHHGGDSAVVRVRYAHHTPHFTAPPTMVTLVLLRRSDGDWRIVRR